MVTSTDTTKVVTDEVSDDVAIEASIAIPESLLGVNVRKLKKGEYISTIGRRKTATTQVRLSVAEKMSIVVNGKPLDEYFTITELQKVVRQPLVKTKYPHSFEISVIVRGGGTTGQAEAIRHGIARALLAYDADTRGPMKRLGYFKRDPRAKERKKFGLKKARKASQWSKR